MPALDYFMESENEARRLEMKTRRSVISSQALWAGLKPGDRLADIGCGPGKTTALLHEIVQPEGEAIGIDASSDRIDHAQRRYGTSTLTFSCRNIFSSLEDLGTFDFIWVRFVLEYYRANSMDILRNLARVLRPGGILCLVDIDQSCMCHYGFPPRLSDSIETIMGIMEMEKNFDPYAGRRLYSYLFDLGFSDIDVQVDTDHLIFGKIGEVDDFNLRSKIQIGLQLLGDRIKTSYPEGPESFLDEFNAAIADERRFIYAPLICCRGRKP